MADFAQFIKFLHVVGAIQLIGGLIGRGLAQREAGRAADIHTLHALIQLSGSFENWMVIPGSKGSNVILIFGLIVSWMRGWPLLGVLQGAPSNWLLVSLLLFLAMIPLIVLIFVPRGKVFEAALQEALARGEITPALTAALHDPVVRRAHIAEALGVLVILYLMVMKPF
jgi:uncharacterized membrane protein